ncbi:MAG: aminotransferase class I/II-fold pyridoxal phosphate-dependent enzyme [Elainellaceae cyanobacterium]
MIDAAKSSTSMPLVEAIARWLVHSHAAFYTPGHKGGASVLPEISQLLGSALRADLPELPGLDNLFSPEGVIEEAQALAAQAFGGDRTWFLANGSTCGIEAALLATCRPHDRIIVPRNAHQSIISGLILSGAMPIFVQPAYDPVWDMALGLSLAQVRSALEQYPEAVAVMLVSPTYYGVCCEIEAIANLVHAHQMPLLVDEAHGPHFGFHPGLPPSALSAGADLTVQSTHKVLSALTQASMLHLHGFGLPGRSPYRISPDRIQKALQMVQSSSPSYLLLASLDAARQQMATEGKALMERTIALAQDARSRLAAIPGLRVLEQSDLGEEISLTLDITRLTVDVTELGLTGFDADEILSEQLGVVAELPTLKTLTFIISLGNSSADIERLVQGFTVLARQHRKTVPPSNGAQVSQADAQVVPFEASIPAIAVPAMSPRDAFFADSEAVAIATAVGRISAELVCPYPPGIPVLLPGEIITAEAVQYLRHILAAGGTVTGCADSTLETLRVVVRPLRD